jgi:serine protease Do/serine protease DegQ
MTLRRDVLVALWLAVLVAAPAHPAMPARLPDGATPSLAPMLERVTPAVVNIATYTTVQVRNPLLEDPFFRRFFDIPEQGRRYRRTQSAGSGVIVDAKQGYLVTNHHVIDRADEITVGLADGRTVKAELVGSDPGVDLAVLKVEPENLTGIRLADSSLLRVGDFVVAIGNPFGLDQTVTSGIVSALGRSGLGIEGYEDFIQTDASINPGNSGGALVNLAGELVGINTAILAPSGGNIGIGFAIPSNMVHAIMTQIVEHGEVRRGRLGVSVQALSPELAEAFGVDWQQGVVVVEVEEESAAAKAGVQPGDILLRIDDRDIRKLVDFHSQSAVLMVGDRVDVTILRDGARRQLALTISADSYEKLAGERLDARLAGVELQNFRAEGDASSAGVVVTGIAEESLAFGYGLREGDVIVAVNRQATRNLSELADGIRRSSRQVLLRVYRAGEFGYIVIR